MPTPRQNLLGLTSEQLSAFALDIGESRYRGEQIYSWLYRKGATSFRSMTDLGKSFRERLEASATIRSLSLVTRRHSPRDGTTKFLFALDDGLRIESVLIPSTSEFRRGEADSEEGVNGKKRLTLCVSTQVGCPLDCTFCATGTMGFLRNLTAGEIVDQVLSVQRLTGRPVTNVVFMGMGEPLMNYDNVMQALGIIVNGIGIAARHVTVSTAGWATNIRRMGAEGCRAKLAVSLHSAVDETRSTLMPINRKFGLRALVSALEAYYAHTKIRVSYEFIFFDGVNDTDREVSRLIAFSRRVPSKVNVIPFHSIAFTAPAGIRASLRPSPRVEEIVARLREEHVTVFVRSNAGDDIAAACGQLAVKFPLRTHPSSGRRRSRQHIRQLE